MPRHEDKSSEEIHQEDYNLCEEMHKEGQQQPNLQDQDDNHGIKLNENNEVQKLIKQHELKGQLEK